MSLKKKVMWINLSLNSSVATRQASRKRFYLDSPLTNVSRVHLTALELTDSDFWSCESLCLYFSEQWSGTFLPFFCCVIPPGHYTPADLCSVVNCALKCPRCVNYDVQTTRNQYKVTVCPRTSKILLRSNGQCPYVIHGNHVTAGGLYHCEVTQVLNDQDFVVSLSCPPVKRGSLITVFSNEVDLCAAQVIEVADTTVTLRTSSPAVKEEDVGRRVTLSPVSTKTSVHSVLGFSEHDESPDSWVSVVASGRLSDKKGVIGTSTPLGAVVNDRVIVYCSNKERHVGTVVDTPSHAHVTITPFPVVSSICKCTVTNAGTQFGTVVRGKYKVDVGKTKRVLHVRLWLGNSEITSTIVCKAQGVAHVFGRVQLRQQRDLSVSFSGCGDSSVVGEKTLHPPLEKVPYVDVEFVDETGVSLGRRDAIGEWTMLLRCCCVLEQHTYKEEGKF